jgi:hypothetical protein
MKNTKKILIITLFAFAFLQSIQAQNIAVSFGVGRKTGETTCIGGTGRCVGVVSPSLMETSLENSNIGVAYFDGSGRMTLSISKINLDENMESEFRDKQFYSLQEDTLIGEGINPNEDKNGEGTILLKGWYPIIETKDHYLVAFSLKK